MITLINRPYGRGAGTLEVLLDVSANNFDTPSDELKAMLKESKTTKRKVGCILQQFSPSLYFSYDPVNQAHMEASLLAALCMPKHEVNVTQGAGGEPCSNY